MTQAEHRPNRRRCFLVALLLFVPALALADDPARGERSLEGRLFAPCCWIQTLDIHDSPLADQLRKEIRARLRSGEHSDQIEADLVARFGERILAVPTGRDSRDQIAWLTFGAMGLALVSLVSFAHRWTQRSASSATRITPELAQRAEPDALDARIEAELRDQAC